MQGLLCTFPYKFVLVDKLLTEQNVRVYKWTLRMKFTNGFLEVSDIAQSKGFQLHDGFMPAVIVFDPLFAEFKLVVILRLAGYSLKLPYHHSMLLVIPALLYIQGTICYLQSLLLATT